MQHARICFLDVAWSSGLMQVMARFDLDDMADDDGCRLRRGLAQLAWRRRRFQRREVRTSSRASRGLAPVLLRASVRDAPDRWAGAGVKAAT